MPDVTKVMPPKSTIFALKSAAGPYLNKVAVDFTRDGAYLGVPGSKEHPLLLDKIMKGKFASDPTGRLHCEAS